jgi:2-iminobutanoate/2-iminopropanoate deaminase
MRKAIQVPELPLANPTYSQAVRAGDFVFVSGQTGIDPRTGALAGDDVAAQVKQALENLKAVLRAAGSSLEKVVSVNLYLTDYRDLPRVNEIYADHFSEPGPAKMSCGVSALYGGAKFEIQAIALA